MNRIYIIILQITQESLSYNIAKDFVFPFLMTLIGAFVAWLVFFRQIVLDKKKERQTKEEDLRNKLTFLAMIVYNAIDNSKGQNSYVKLLIGELQIRKHDVLALNSYKTYDLKIIAEKMDIQDYLLSYLSFYSAKKKLDILNEFKEIVDGFVIINDVFKQIESDLKSRHEFVSELSKNFYELSEECADLLGLCLVNLRDEKSPLFQRFFKIHQIQMNGTTNNDFVEAQYTTLIKPLLDLLDSLHNENLEFNEEQGKLWMISTKAVSIYKNLHSESIHHATRASEDYNLVNELIATIEKASNNLRNDFLN